MQLYKNIYPHFLYTLWGDNQNVSETRSIYARNIAFPFKFYYPSKYITNAQETLEILSNIDIDDKIEMNDLDDVSFVNC